jgi:hypothetical protein
MRLVDRLGAVIEAFADAPELDHPRTVTKRGHPDMETYGTNVGPKARYVSISG